MPNPPASSNAPHGSTSKRKRLEQGWARHKARDARRTAEHYEGTIALVKPRYALGAVHEKQRHLHLDPPVPEKFAEASFDRFRGWLVRALRAPWPAKALVQLQNPQTARRPLVTGTLASPTRGHSGPRAFR